LHQTSWLVVHHALRLVDGEILFAVDRDVRVLPLALAVVDEVALAGSLDQYVGDALGLRVTQVTPTRSSDFSVDTSLDLSIWLPHAARPMNRPSAAPTRRSARP
jgi:hypothetical protein